ncbi:hypothetical protein WJX82_005653 [Trebouxia sp. C0006]
MVHQVAGKRFLRRRWPFPSVEYVARLRGVRALASTQVQVGDVVQLHCTKLALGARGVCRHVSGLVVFTDALPGEQLTARVNKVKKGYAEATKVTTLQSPLNLADPPCPHFSVCGGCNYQNLQYDAQLLAKQQQVSETLQRIGGISNCNDVLLPIIPCQQQYHYRNNMQFTFSEAPFQHKESQRQQSHVLFGTSTITERLCELDFQISPESFFQVNSAQAEVLYDLVHKAAGLRSTDIVMDLFCGTGSIGLTLAQDCHHVYGFESTASSVVDARRNAEVNGISNATFVHGDLTKVAAMMGKQYPNPDVIVTDPARAGMSLEVIKYMQQSGARTIVYVSCNPATQARDISQLCTGACARFQGSVYANEAPQLDFLRAIETG